jgi:4-diphosphocytidyl-2-C-methyl-D-erythritol kinase
MVVFPNAKLNIGLNVIERRPDGLHNLESIFYPVPVYDGLEAVPADEWGIHYYGRAIQAETGPDTVEQALTLLQEEVTVPPASLCLYKQIPQAAGLGGGSADGTFTLTLLNQLHNLGLSETTLARLSQQIGSDCPFFMTNQPALVTGTGAVLEPIDLDLAGYYFGIITPPQAISTKAAYQHIKPQKPQVSVAEAIQHPLSEWPSLLGNAFEAYAFATYPALQNIKNALYDQGALFASMTGSGSAFYGLFERKPNLTELSWPADYRVFEGPFK